jgi:Aspartyl/asparaginyl-tRNA synthetases
VVFLTVPACSKQPAPPVQPVQAPSASGAGPAASATTGGDTVTGAVLETMDAASYTYVRVGSDKGDVWAAAPQFPVKVGERVTVPLEMPMKNFHSQSLNRDFPVIYFVSRISREGEAATSSPAAAITPTMMNSHGAGVSAAPPQAIQPMTPPPGGMSIANLWANRKSLAGKSVTIHGRVVKFNGGILGHTWVTLRDGTGKAADNTNDITVTTDEDVVANVGDTITVTGTVVLDKDLGAGYAYAAVIENARVVGSKKS